VGLIHAEEHGADTGQCGGKNQREIGAGVSERGLHEYQQEACNRGETGPDAARNAVRAFGSKGECGDGNDDGDECESDGEAAGVEIPAANQEGYSGASEEHRTGEQPAQAGSV
jgi:hypothetical protein